MGTEKIKISVILTVHNSETYLRECIESACNQSLQEIEILCIDGGSTDSSPLILQEYQKKDSRIRIINDTNTSYGHKVNLGITEAKGEYIEILETDDYLGQNMLQILYEYTVDNHPDFVDCDHYNFFTIDDYKFCTLAKKYNDETIYDHFIKHGDEKIPYIIDMWTGIYRRDFLIENDLWLNESAGASYQDISFRFLTATLAKTSYHVSKPLHFHRIDNMGSSVRDMSKINVVAYEFDFLKKQLEVHCVQNPNIWQCFYEWKYLEYQWNFKRLYGAAQLEFLETYKKELSDDVKKCPSDWIEPTNLELLNDAESFIRKMCEEAALQENINKRKVDVVKIVCKQKVVIFGAGRRGKAFLQLIDEVKHNVLCIVDNSKGLWGSNIKGISVLPPAEAIEKYPDAFYIIANKYHSDEIAKQLQELGITDENIHTL